MSNMENNHSAAAPERPRILLSFLIIVAISLVALFIGNFVGLIAILPFFDWDLNQVTLFLGNPTANPSGRIPLLVVQGISSIFAFLIGPIIYISRFERGGSGHYFKLASPLWPAILLTLFISQSFMFVNTPFIEWNLNLDFPDFMNSFEEFARSQEEYLREITDYVTNFDSISGLLLGLLVIAVIPGVGEELLFRGLIQRKITRLFNNNAHVGIWVAALLFGLFHFQFYGVVPRMLLGALFGYLYWWSGSLSLAVIAHFFNNGFTLIMVYLYQKGMIDFDMEGTSSIPLPSLIFFTVIFAALCFYFSRLIQHQKISDE